jgi:hypothetical protein
MKLRPDPGSPEAFTANRTCACGKRVVIEAGDIRIIRTRRIGQGRVEATCVCGATLDVGEEAQLPRSVVDFVEGLSE